MNPEYPRKERLPILALVLHPGVTPGLLRLFLDLRIISGMLMLGIIRGIQYINRVHGLFSFAPQDSPQ